MECPERIEDDVFICDSETSTNEQVLNTREVEPKDSTEATLLLSQCDS